MLISVTEFASKIVVKTDVNLLPIHLHYFHSLIYFFSISVCENSIFVPHVTSLSQDYFFYSLKDSETKEPKEVKLWHAFSFKLVVHVTAVFCWYWEEM